MTDIFKEVDEALKQDRALAWWKKNSRYVYGAVVLILLATGGYQIWKWYDLNQRSAASDRFAEALELVDSGGQEQALAALSEIRRSGGGGYSILAAFQEARLLAEQGDTAAAVARWDEIAADTASGPAYQGVATLLSVMHQLESGDPAVLQARLDKLSGAAAAFRPSALELSAALALRAGDREKARSLYSEIAADLGAPSGLRARATQMLAALQN